MKTDVTMIAAASLLLAIPGCTEQRDISSFTPNQQRVILQCRYESNAATAGMRERSILGLEKIGTQNSLFRQCVEAKVAYGEADDAPATAPASGDLPANDAECMRSFGVPCPPWVRNARQH